jgi:hypothetical protein
MTLLGSGAQTDEEVRTYTEDGDHERYAHYAPADEVTYAIIEGVPIMALCGKIWIPNRDPKKFPVCPTCKEIYEGMDE